MPRFDQCTKEQLAEYGRRGGRTKAENYKTRRGICETMKILLEMSLSTGKVNTVDEIRAFGKLKGKNVIVRDAICIRLVQKALTGDLKAIEMVRDTVGEKPTDKLDITDLTPTVLTGEGDIRE